MPNWWDQTGPPAMRGETDQIGQTELQSCAVAPAAVAACSLFTIRSVALPIFGRTASSSAGFSSAYAVWRPFTTIQVERVTLFNSEQWILTTDTDITVFRNSSSCVAGVTLVSTAPAAGTRSAFGAVNNAAVTANTDVTVKFTFSTCAEPSVPKGFLVIDYKTTG